MNPPSENVMAAYDEVMKNSGATEPGVDQENTNDLAVNDSVVRTAPQEETTQKDKSSSEENNTPSV